MLDKIAMKSLYRIVITITLAVALSGCEAIRTMDSFDGILGQSEKQKAEMTKLNKAESAFFKGRYTQAKKLYGDVYRNSKTAPLKNEAYYGLICVSIATAQNRSDLRKAIAMMSKWRKPRKAGSYLENPKMIFHALNKKTKLLDSGSEVQVITAKKKIAVSQEQLEEIEQLKQTIKKLEHQISVLEAIDLEIQEKRKPL